MNIKKTNAEKWLLLTVLLMLALDFFQPLLAAPAFALIGTCAVVILFLRYLDGILNSNADDTHSFATHYTVFIALIAFALVIFQKDHPDTQRSGLLARYVPGVSGFQARLTGHQQASSATVAAKSEKPAVTSEGEPKYAVLPALKDPNYTPGQMQLSPLKPRELGFKIEKPSASKPATEPAQAKTEVPATNETAPAKEIAAKSTDSSDQPKYAVLPALKDPNYAPGQLKLSPLKPRKLGFKIEKPGASKPAAAAAKPKTEVAAANETAPKASDAAANGTDNANQPATDDKKTANADTPPADDKKTAKADAPAAEDKTNAKADEPAAQDKKTAKADAPEADDKKTAQTESSASDSKKSDATNTATTKKSESDKTASTKLKTNPSTADKAAARAALKAKGIDWNPTAFYKAASVGELDIMRLFVQGGMSAETQLPHYKQSVIVALVQHNPEAAVKSIQFFVDNGFDLNKKVEVFYAAPDKMTQKTHRTLMELAVMNLNLEVAKYLKSKGVRTDSVLRLIAHDLKASSIQQKRERIQQMYQVLTGKAFVPTNVDELNLKLSEALKISNVGLMEFYLLAGAKPDYKIKGKKQSYLLFRAAQTEKAAAIVKLLIKYGANVNLKSETGRTALFVHTQMNRYEAVQALLNAKADPNARAKDGATPIYTAAKENRIAILRLLVKAGANVNIQLNNGKTPLMVASQNGHQDVVELLLQSGANTNMRDKKGMTPVDYANLNGNEKIILLLSKKKPDAEPLAW